MIHILGGGTFSHIRSHLALSVPAFGTTAKHLHELHPDSVLHLTKMADSNSAIVTNDDVAAWVDKMIDDPECRVIYFNVALCDFTATIGDIPSGKYAERLQSRDGPHVANLQMADKLIGRIRRERKDIFVVGFKTTSGATPDEQYIKALDLLKSNSLNLVLANDTVTRNNMIVTPEEARYGETKDRAASLEALAFMVSKRSTNHFTRSEVVDGDLISFDADSRVHDNLREVVKHMVARGAYQPFRGSTVGHFAVRIDDTRCMTSRRKSNFNSEHGLDLVAIEYKGLDNVRAIGAKPSVGGQSQRIIFDRYPDADCIVHAHVEMRADGPLAKKIGVGQQIGYECGSHECGQNTADNLTDIGKGIRAVMLDNHGPNIVFSRDVAAIDVIDFIEANFDLGAKTGGSVVAA